MYDDTPIFRDAEEFVRYDTPIFRELAEDSARNRNLAQALGDAIYRDHYEFHEGAIIFCPAAACQVLTERRRAA